MTNDMTQRPQIWHRYAGDDWACFDALPGPIRLRLQEHAYDAWAVNALMLWRRLRRKHGGSSTRAMRSLLRYLDECEALEREAYDEAYRQRHGHALPHLAAHASVLRYGGG